MRLPRLKGCTDARRFRLLLTPWLRRGLLQVMAYRLIYKYNVFNAQAGRKVLTRDMSHYAEGHEMQEKHGDDVVQLSYNVKTGKAVAADLKKHMAENGGTGTPGASMVSTQKDASDQERGCTLVWHCSWQHGGLPKGLLFGARPTIWGS